MKIGYYAGLGIGEISCLKWDNITQTTLEVNKQWNRNQQKFSPSKSKNSYRTIPLKKGVIPRTYEIQGKP